MKTKHCYLVGQFTRVPGTDEMKFISLCKDSKGDVAHYNSSEDAHTEAKTLSLEHPSLAFATFDVQEFLVRGAGIAPEVIKT